MTKQRVSNSYAFINAKNFTEHLYPESEISISITRSEHCYLLNRGKFFTELSFKYVVSKALTVDNEKVYLCIPNSGVIFDKTQVMMAGRNVYTGDENAIRSRLYQMAQSKSNILSNPSSYLNIDDIEANAGFIAVELNNTVGEHEARFRVSIPIAMILPCFESCNSLYTNELESSIDIKLHISQPMDYLGLATVRNNKIEKISPIRSSSNIAYGEDFMVKYFNLMVPFEYPSSDDRKEFSETIRTFGGVEYPYRDFEINNQSKRRDNGNFSIQFATSENNQHSIAILFSKQSSSLFFKPHIKNVRLEIGGNNDLAMDQTYKDDIFSNNAKLLQQYINATGQNVFFNISRFDESVLRDYAKDESLGSFVQMFKSSPAGQLGRASTNYHSSLIGYHFQTTEEFTEESFVISCCVLTSNILKYSEGNLESIQPFPEEIDAKEIEAQNPIISHGLPLAAIGTGIGGLWKIGTQIGNAIKRKRFTNNTMNAYKRLGKDLYEKHREIIEQTAHIRKKKFNKFLDSLTEMNHGVLVRHGVIIPKVPRINEHDLDFDRETQRRKMLKKLRIKPINSTSHGAEEDQEDFEHESNIDTDLIDKQQLVYDVPKRSFRGSYNLMIETSPFINKVLMDYRGNNQHMIKLWRYGAEWAIFKKEDVSHGFGSWIKNKFRKLKVWVKPKAKDLLKEGAEIAKNYALDVMNGKLQINDIPSKFRDQVLGSLQSEFGKVGVDKEAFDKGVDQVADIVNRLRRSQMKWSDVPADIISKVRSQYSRPVNHGIISPNPLGIDWNRYKVKAFANKALRHIADGKIPNGKERNLLLARRFVKAIYPKVPRINEHDLDIEKRRREFIRTKIN